MKVITKFQTEDGFIFDNEDEAIEHEKVAAARTKLNSIALRIDYSDDIGSHVLYQEKFAVFVLANRKELLAILKEIKE
jgi:hypothetical protein